MMNTLFARFLLILVISGTVAAQSFRELNNRGVSDYKAKKYTDAEINFRKAAAMDTSTYKAQYNLGTSYAKQQKPDDAIQSLNAALGKAKNDEEKASIQYNLGNAHLWKKDYQQSIEAYKNALKINPSDEDARYNLAYALRMLQQQQQQKQENKNNKDKQQDKKDEQQKQDNKQEQKKKEDGKQNEQQQQQQKKDQEQQKQQQPARPKIAKEEAKRILETMKNNEQELQKKLRQKVGVRVKTDKDW